MRGVHVRRTHEAGAKRVEGPAGLLRGAGTGCGQFHMLRMAQEQARAGLRLQPPYVVAHRRRAGVELLRGTGETAQPRRCLEGADRDKRWQLPWVDHKCDLA
jgi:K+-sensing histidine kinase KdpD